MTDVFTEEKRSWIMSRIKGRNSKPELEVRKLLFANGFRFRLHVKDLPGKPDIVLPKYRTVIFVHGCFWHGHTGCKRAILPSTNEEFWKQKIEKNIQRDKVATMALKRLGWRIIVVWDEELKDKNRLANRLKRLLSKGVINVG